MPPNAVSGHRENSKELSLESKVPRKAVTHTGYRKEEED